MVSPLKNFPGISAQASLLGTTRPLLVCRQLGREYLIYDDPERSLEDIRQSAELAALESTLNDFPNGLNTLIGERGVTLSGGQKQRCGAGERPYPNGPDIDPG